MKSKISKISSNQSNQTKYPTVLIASDHAGYQLKEFLKHHFSFQKIHYKVKDLGTYSSESVDYPDYAHLLSRLISNGEQERAILLCGSGIGMSIVANRYPNVRAALCWNYEIARLSREHNDSNILVLPARFLDLSQAYSIVLVWLETKFAGGRHQKRIDKIDNLSRLPFSF